MLFLSAIKDPVQQFYHNAAINLGQVREILAAPI